MIRNRDQRPFDAEIAAIPDREFVDLITGAYRAGDRNEFVRLSQRLVWDVVGSTIRTARLRPHRLDLYSVGVVALIEHFDRGATVAVERPFGFYRRVVYIKLLQWLYSQRILRRKGAKHASIILDADISARTDDGWSLIDAATADATDWMRATTACKPGKARCRPRVRAKGRAKPRTKRPPLAFDGTVTDTPKQLREQGRTWKAIGELLGISPTAAFNAAKSRTQRSPQELREQAATSRDARARAKSGRDMLRGAVA
jgi:hypothetical protein